MIQSGINAYEYERCYREKSIEWLRFEYYQVLAYPKNGQKFENVCYRCIHFSSSITTHLIKLTSTSVVVVEREFCIENNEKSIIRVSAQRKNNICTERPLFVEGDCLRLHLPVTSDSVM
jgi:hypothetical protein